MNNQKQHDWKRTLKYFSIYLAIVFLSLLALTGGYLLELFKPFEIFVNWPVFNKLLVHLFNEAGIAGLIASGLGITIERISAGEFIKLAEDQRVALIEQSQHLAAREREAIKQDVFFYSFGVHLPEDIRTEIKTQILTQALIRPKMSMSYTVNPLVDLESRSDYVLVETELIYDIINLTGEKKGLVLKHSFRRSPIPSLAEQAKFLEIDVQGPGHKLNLIGDQIPTKSEQDFISLNYVSPVSVEPGSDNPTTVKIRLQNVKHCWGGYSYFTLDYHTCDLELSVIVPGNTLDVYAGVSPKASPGVWLEETFRHRPRDGYYNWQLKRPLLAFQGVYLGWDPKQATAVEPLKESEHSSGQGYEVRLTSETVSEALPLFDSQPKPVQGHTLHIASPREGENVWDDGWVTGTANVPSDSFLWVFVGASALPNQWWPQGPGLVEIKEDSSWAVHVFYGQRGEAGSFRIAAIVVDQKTNRQLKKRYAAGVIKGHYDAMDLPQPIQDNLLEVLAVEKTIVPLAQVKSLKAEAIERRSKVERRGKVLAVKNERRLSLDRRSRKAG